MTFRPEAMRGAPNNGAFPGQVDFRLARNSIVNEFKRGRLSRHEVCDAHPELLRAARNLGEPSTIECPICADQDVVFVSYVFGPRMPPSGKVVENARQMAKLAGRTTELACYVVEVCPSCSWNHLARMFPVGGGARGVSARRRDQPGIR